MLLLEEKFMAVTPNNNGISRRSGLAFAISAIFAGGNVSAQESIDEIIVKGQGGVGSIRLGVRNDAGSRLGLSALDTPASVGIISREEIATKGDYGALDTVTRAVGVSASASPGNGAHLFLLVDLMDTILLYIPTTVLGCISLQVPSHFPPILGPWSE